MSKSKKDPSPSSSKGSQSNSDDGEGQAPKKTGAWLWLIAAIFTLYLIMFAMDPGAKDLTEVSIVFFMQQLETTGQGRTDAIRNIRAITGQEAHKFLMQLREEVTYTDYSKDEPKAVRSKNIYAVIADEPARTELLAIAKANNIQLKDYDNSGAMLTSLLFSIFPIFILVLVFWFMASRVRKQMGAPGIFGKFGGNRAKKYDSSKSSVTFKDVASLKNVKVELAEIVEFLSSPDRFTKLGAQIPKGVLLVGPPGTGKTLLARAVAGEAGVPFYSISGSEFIELFVGMGASRVRELFDEAKKNAPCIVFIDEIDAVGRSRGAGLGGGHDEREQTLNQILSEMDGFEPNENVIVLAATNRPDVLDKALTRPGRFDRQVVVERPQLDGRKQILKVHTKEIPLDESVELDQVARSTIGFSGADLRNLANEAALMAARRKHEQVTQDDFESARDKITLGTLRDESMSERERTLTAYHEAGHALVAMLLKDSDPVQTVTIVPRGRALGVTLQAPAEEVHSYSKTYLINRVKIALGGRAAEELIFNEFTTGAENDLQQSTSLVERMVCRWGMSEKLGPMSFPRGEEHVFLGKELGETKHYSEHTAMLIDDEMRGIVERCYTQAMELLESNKDKLKLFAEELLEREVLTSHEIYNLIDIPLPKALADELAAKEEAAVKAEEKAKAKAAAKPPAKPAEKKTEEIDPGLLGLEGA